MKPISFAAEGVASAALSRRGYEASYMVSLDGGVSLSVDERSLKSLASQSSVPSGTAMPTP